MPGIPGAGGPPPKRSDQRRRTNKPANPIIEASGAVEVPIPEADPDWHPVAARWFNSLALSGQSVFYEPSDWALAYALAESMSLEFKPQPVVDRNGNPVADGDGNVQTFRLPPKASSLASWLKGMTVLLVGEGDRRRVGLELQRPKGEEAGDDSAVSELDEYRNRLTS